MARYVINSKKDLQALVGNNTEFEVGDLIIHKKLEFAEIQGEFQMQVGEVELFPAMAGTDIFTEYGENCSIIKDIS